MIINRGYKFRLYPNKEQEELLQKINESVPFMSELAKAEGVIEDYPKVKSKAYKWIAISLWPAILGIMVFI